MLTINGEVQELKPMPKAIAFHLSDRFRATDIVKGKKVHRVANYKGVKTTTTVKDKTHGDVQMMYYVNKGVGQNKQGQNIEKIYPNVVVFEDGKLLAKKTMPDLHEFLIKHPKFGVDFIIYDPIAIAKKSVSTRQIKFDAQQYIIGANRLTKKEMEDIAIGVDIAGAGQMEPSELEDQLLDFIELNPEKFIDNLNSKSLDARIDIQKCRDAKILDWSEGVFWYMLDGGKKSKIVKVPVAEKPMQWFATWLNDVDASGVLDNLRTKLSAHELESTASGDTEGDKQLALIIKAEHLGVERPDKMEIVELQAAIREKEAFEGNE